MSKKLILCIFCSLACITMACSDDKDNDSYKEGAACTENRVGGIGGLCDGNTSVKCINGHIRITPCSDGCEMRNGEAVCSMPNTKGCGSIDDKGTCRNGNVVKCVDGQLKEDLCGTGQECQRQDDVAQCVQVDELCGEITADGKCENNDKTLVYCKSGLIQRVDCHPKCMTLDGVFHQCFEKCTPEFEKLGEVGKCDGNGYAYCNNQYGMIRLSCGRGEVCGEDANGNNRCLATSSKCGNISASGVCEGDTLKYCNAGTIKTEECTEGCITVQDGAKSMAQCRKPCGAVDDKGVCASGDRVVNLCDSNLGLIEKPCNNGQKCAVVGGKAQCVRNESSTDSDVTLNCNTNEGRKGKCVGNVNYYCSTDGKTERITCTHSRGCAVDVDGLAQCYTDCNGIAVEQGKCSDDGKSLIICDKDVGLLEFYCPDQKPNSTCKQGPGGFQCML